MRINRASCLIIVVVMLFATNCMSDNQSLDGIPTINVRKRYPIKEILITDIAEVLFVHLCTEQNDFLFRGGISYITENTIVVVDKSSGSILFFSKDGSPKSRFNRIGQGPEEYVNTLSKLIVFDEARDEVFIHSPHSFFSTSGNSIMVFSSSGEFKRRIMLPGGAVFPMINFCDQSLFVYDMLIQRNKAVEGQDFVPPPIDSSIFRISKKDGAVLEHVAFPSNSVNLTDLGDGQKILNGFHRIMNSTNGLIISNPEADTIFLLCKNRVITPIFAKAPSIHDVQPFTVWSSFVDTKRFQFLSVHTLIGFDEILRIPSAERYSRLNRHFVYDKYTSKIFHPRLLLPDFSGKEIVINASRTFLIGKGKVAHFELDLIEMKQAYRDNKLSGRLKELVSTLDEYEDNNVFMLVYFR